MIIENREVLAGEAMYPVHILNEATWQLYREKGHEGETYWLFLQRVFTDFATELEELCKHSEDTESWEDRRLDRQEETGRCSECGHLVLDCLCE